MTRPFRPIRLVGALRGRIGFLAVAVVLVLAACTSDAANADGDRIIVSGASGNLGGLVVEELLDRGVPPEELILVSRTPEQLEEYANLGASTRFGDFSEPESLPDAYAGGSRMLLISINTYGNPVGDERPRMHQNAIDAAVEAGVEHIVYTSFVNAEENPSPIAPDHRLTEEMLRESGVTWTALRNQLYADLLLDQAAQMVAEGRAVVDPEEPGTAYVARRDCAAAAAAVLTTEGHENQIYEITGPELVETRDVAMLAGEITGQDVEIVEERGEETPDPAAVASARTRTDAVEDLTGRPPMTVRDLFEQNREALTAAD